MTFTDTIDRHPILSAVVAAVVIEACGIVAWLLAGDDLLSAVVHSLPFAVMTPSISVAGWALKRPRHRRGLRPKS